MTKIFVSIACFMDPDILNTIDNCLKKATHPDNIVFGICLQHEQTDDFLQKYDNNPQFRIHRMDWTEAKGPAYARGIIYQLFRDEDYYFQIDCHTRFFDDWDTKIIACLKECTKVNPKAVISHYPVNINEMYTQNSQIVNISTVRCIDVNNGIKTHGRHIKVNTCPQKSWGISSAMLFFDKSTFSQIPFDRNIYFGLQFEEQLRLCELVRHRCQRSESEAGWVYGGHD